MPTEREESIDPVHEEAKAAIEPLAATEFDELVTKLKYDARKARLLYKRSLGRVERIRRWWKSNDGN